MPTRFPLNFQEVRAMELYVLSVIREEFTNYNANNASPLARLLLLEGVATPVPAATGDPLVDRANIVTAIASASADGGGTVELAAAPTASPYIVDMNIEVPALVNLVGAGKDATVIKLSTAASRIRFEGYGGRSGNFSVHGGGPGARVAQVGIEVGVLNQRRFHDIDCKYTTVDGWQINGTQNSVFVNCTAYDHAGNGFALDKGCGSNVFINPGVSNCAGWGVDIRQTAFIPGLYTEPTHNQFISPVIERPYGDGGVAALGLVRQRAGNSNAFVNPAIGNVDIADAQDLIRMSLDASAGATVSSLIVEQGYLIANGASTAFQLQGNTRLFVRGRTVCSQPLNTFRLNDTDFVDIDGYIETYQTTFAAKASGVTPWYDLIKRHDFSVGRLQTVRGVSEPGHEIKVEGETYPRISMRPDVIYMGDGTGYDLDLYRVAAQGWKTGAKLLAEDGLGVGNHALATVLGSVVRKMEVFNSAGVSIGFVPVYDTIT